MAARPTLDFLRTADHECSYLPDEVARTVFVDPNAPMSPAIYGVLLRHGFRRSGEQIYRPHCQSCGACIPIRVPVNQFRASRRQRRARQANVDLQVRPRPARYDPESFDLYRRYLSSRHGGGSMDNPTPQSFENFLLSNWAASEFIEFRLARTLVAVAVLDLVDDGLSAVYTFFDPALPRRSLGTNAVVWSIEEAARRGLDYLYLGYWIQASPKMAYKGDFLPQQRFDGAQWSTTAGLKTDRDPSRANAL